MTQLNQRAFEILRAEVQKSSGAIALVEQADRLINLPWQVPLHSLLDLESGYKREMRIPCPIDSGVSRERMSGMDDESPIYIHNLSEYRLRFSKKSRLRCY